MTELQLGLLILGVAAVIIVLMYNKWQERRYSKLAGKMLHAPTDDVLLNAQRIPLPEQDEMRIPAEELREPETPSVPNMPNVPNVPPTYTANARIEPVINSLDDVYKSEEYSPQPPKEEANAHHNTDSEPAAPAFNEPPYSEPHAINFPAVEERAQHLTHEEHTAHAAAPVTAKEVPASVFSERTIIGEPLDLLSPQIDYIVALSTASPVSAAQILDPQRDLMMRLRKPVRWVGYNALEQAWELISAHSLNEYQHVRVGIQLVDRQGFLQESDLSAFCLALQDLALQLVAAIDFPHRQPSLDSAIKLDEFCASVDIQIGINVLSQGISFPGTKIRALTEAAGMSLDNEGRFVRRDDDGHVLYALLNQEIASFSAEGMKTLQTRGITFLLDVPCVANGERVFVQMLERAKHFADVLRGVIVDDNRRPLEEKALEPIRQQIGHYQATMNARGFSPGAPLTLRLFS